MNETLKVIKNRRSIRKYKPDQVGDAELQQIINSAIYAPSARNQQKWHFTVIQDKDVIDKMAKTIRDNALKSGHGYAVTLMGAPGYHVFYNAPTVIVVSCDPDAILIEMDCGIAVENMCLAAESLGIGSCIIGLSRFILLSEEGITLLEGLGFPKGYNHLCTLSLGYVDGEKPPMPERNWDVVNYLK